MGHLVSTSGQDMNHLFSGAAGMGDWKSDLRKAGHDPDKVCKDMGICNSEMASAYIGLKKAPENENMFTAAAAPALAAKKSGSNTGYIIAGLLAVGLVVWAIKKKV